MVPTVKGNGGPTNVPTKALCWSYVVMFAGLPLCSFVLNVVLLSLLNNFTQFGAVFIIICRKRRCESPTHYEAVPVLNK